MGGSKCSSLLQLIFVYSCLMSQVDYPCINSGKRKKKKNKTVGSGSLWYEIKWAGTTTESLPGASQCSLGRKEGTTPGVLELGKDSFRLDGPVCVVKPFLPPVLFHMISKLCREAKGLPQLWMIKEIKPVRHDLLFYTREFHYASEPLTRGGVRCPPDALQLAKFPDTSGAQREAILLYV